MYPNSATYSNNANDGGSALKIGGKLQEYRIEEVLGCGAFGITYKAVDTNLGFYVAIKELFPEELVIRDDEQRIVLKSNDDRILFKWVKQRFLDEGKILARFKHTNIVRVNRFFQANETAYIVMDYEEGESLSSVLSYRAGPLNEERAREIFEPILNGLKHVHGHRYLHRDIKPGNIYLRHDGSPILLDFGAARLEMSASDSEKNQLITPGYAPIEQYYTDSKQGPWSDIYAVGATIYRCLTKKTPVDAYQRMRCIDAGQPDPLLPLAEIATEYASPGFLQSIDSMLSISAEERPQYIQEVLDRWHGKAETADDRRPSAFTYIPKQAAVIHKLLIAGPVGVGKTTAIHALSDSGLFTTEEAATDIARDRKQHTTVVMDYGSLRVSKNEIIRLYGAPGQQRFSFMWEILQKGAIGLLLLIDNSRRFPLKDLSFYLDSFRDLIRNSTVVIGVNRLDEKASPTIDDYYRFLHDEKKELHIKPAIFAIDPRESADMERMISALLYTLDPVVEEYYV